MEDLQNDTIEFKLQRERAAEVEEQLKCFGWEIESERDDRFYSDVVHVRFVRPHKIEQKDRLQLLQVRVEIALNNQARYERTMNTRAVTLGISLGLILVLILGLGIAYVLYNYYVPWGIALIATSSVLLICSTVFSVKLRRYDRIKYAALLKANAENIERYCRSAREITGRGGDL